MKPIHPQARIGHVHLKVADLERSLGFYRDVLGFEVPPASATPPPSSQRAATITTSA